MPFCTSCGKEITTGAKFCSSCGKEQISGTPQCSNCGKELGENEKFCSDCGTPVVKNTEKKVQDKTKSEPKPKEEDRTPEGRKIIKAATKAPVQMKQAPTAKRANAPTKRPPKNKKRSPVGCFFRTLFILISIVAVSALIIVVVNVFFIEDDGAKTNTAQEYNAAKNDGLTDTNIPGIVDIEPGDESHLPENRSVDSKAISTTNFQEDKAIKKAAKSVEEAFEKADITLLKQQLSESAQSQYSGVFEQIQPHMKDYAGAFKKRKLISSTEAYKVYEFSAGSGEKYSAAFAFQPDGSWKLVRF
ncbi:zinc ribbon domain-containing protein [uncultured Draconibacterium sp.]|uniref:zinc ribbon domain-containing protein n=1 Tax=uncultured Draconibacterium sp. TaxID=1573823 RepID=UPI003216CFBF